MKNLLFILATLFLTACSTDLIDMGQEDTFEALTLDEENPIMTENVVIDEIQEWMAEVSISDMKCSATDPRTGETTLYLGENYSINALLKYTDNLNWSPNVAFYLSSDTLLHIDTREGHLYTDWITPSERWQWCGAPSTCNPVDGPIRLGSGQIYINPMFWGDGVGDKPFGTYYLIGVADQAREIREKDEQNNHTFMKITVKEKRESNVIMASLN